MPYFTPGSVYEKFSLILVFAVFSRKVSVVLMQKEFAQVLIRTTEKFLFLCKLYTNL